VFSLDGEEAEDPTITVSGTVLINHLYAYVLFDSSATHSFVNPVFPKKFASKPSEMDIQLYVTTPLGFTYYTMLFSKIVPSIRRKRPPYKSNTARYTRLGCYFKDGLVS